MRFLCFCLVFSLACGDDDGGAVDASTDSSTPIDAAEDARDAAADVALDTSGGTDAGDDASDAGTDDAGTDAGEDDAGEDDAGADAGTDAARDAGTDTGTDAGTDAGVDSGTDAALPFDAAGACHDNGFGRPVVSFERVASLPPLTGGTIPLGAYDLVRIQTTTALDGAGRGTWTFESDSVVQTLDWIAISGPPSTPTPRTQSWRTEGTMLLRQQTCGGDSSFMTGYRVTSADGRTLLDVGSGATVLTYQLR
ncbi:MAG: hypothetical protein AAGE52_17915 [Myxococcota bacterium]